jgi:hypothetical protein
MSVLGWIAVPGGRVEEAPDASENLVVLRVLVVPRLQQQLADTAMADWPAVVKDAVPVVDIQPPGAAIRELQCGLRNTADSDVWRGFFGHGITVNPWQPPVTPATPTVRPTLQQAADITATYAAAADDPNDPTVTDAQLSTWHAAPAPAPATGPKPTFAKVDFHRAVSLLREHPHVLKALGLILELEIAATEVPASTGDPATLIRVRWPAAPIAIESPWTAYQFTGAHFLPASGGDIVSGQVDLADDDKWQVITVDVDGAVHKLRQTAQAVLDGHPPASRKAVLPVLKSAGLQLARKNRAQQLADRNNRGRTNLAAGSLDGRVFTADDLVLGYRLDIRPQASNTWYSLHARLAHYQIDGRSIGAAEVSEEGHLKPHTMIKDGDGLHTDEIVARWSGWSLAVPRPTFDGQPADGVATDAAGDLIPYRFAVEFSVAPQTLPELRFGKAYQLRARVVDVAGGGLARDDPDAAASPTPEVPYTRYEPVPPPDLVVPDGVFVPAPNRPGGVRVDPDRFGPGGTLERLVIRSSPTAAGFSAAEFDGDPAYPANDRRSFTPPATTFQLADQHGVLSADDEIDWPLAARAGSLEPGSPLPDPIALGAAATLLPEAGGLDEARTDARPWAGDWPDHDPKHIELVPGARNDEIALRWLASGEDVAPEDDAQSTTVRVTVPPGEHVVVELSSTILRDHLDWFSFSALMSGGTADAAAVGRHPMVTPARRLELVHAVRRPLDPPKGPLTTARPAASTFATLHPQDPIFGVHTPSTAQIALNAEWDEWSDAPTANPATAPLPPVTVTYGAAALPEIRQEFGDTKHRMIRYTVTAVSRYRAFFAAPVPDDTAAFAVSTTFEPVSVKSSVRPAPPTVVATVPAFSWSDAPRPGGGLIRTRSAARLRVELGRPWFTTGEGECVAVLVWPGTEDTVPAEVRPLVSWLNRDPIHPTPAPPALATESMFAGAVEPLDVVLVETGHTVRALPYPVFFHDGRWYADIAVPGAAQSSYAPFAHLALARFQRESLDDRDLSTVVRTDMVPVLPDRSLDVHIDASGVHVVLSGLSRAGNRPNRVTATIERCDASDDGTPIELTALNANAPAFSAWVRVPGLSAVGQTNQPLPPIAVPDHNGRLRVVVREVEDLPSTATGLVDAVRELTERTVYLDAVTLPID